MVSFGDPATYPATYRVVVPTFLVVRKFPPFPQSSHNHVIQGDFDGWYYFVEGCPHNLRLTEDANQRASENARKQGNLIGYVSRMIQRHLDVCSGTVSAEGHSTLAERGDTNEEEERRADGDGSLPASGS